MRYGTFRKYRKHIRKPGVSYKTKQAVKTIVKKQIDKAIEDKYTTSALTDTWASVNTIPTEKDLCNPAQGTTSITRIGRKIRLKSVEVNGVLAQGSTGTLSDDPYNVFRVILGLYTGSSTTPLSSLALTAPLMKDSTGGQLLKSKLYDEYIPLTVVSTEKGGGDGYTPALKKFKLYKKLNKVITWADDTTTYPDTRLIMSCISDSTVVVNPGFITGYVIVRWEDA